MTIQQGEFCWNELMTPDASKAKEFYGDLLGWTSHDLDMGEMTYTLFKSGDKDIGGMMQTPTGQEENIPPHWMSYIMVDDIDVMCEKAASLGASLEVPIQTIENTGRFCLLKDPTGAHIALWQQDKKS